MKNRIYYTEYNSPDGVLYSGDGSEKGHEPYPLHEDQGNGTFKRYRIAPPQIEPLDVLEKQLLDNIAEQAKLRTTYIELWENFCNITGNKMNNGTWTVTLEEDSETGDLILPFPPEFMEENDWRIDDTLKFTVNNDSCTITNISWEERHKDEVAES